MYFWYMLKRLQIENYAIIEELDIHLHEGLSIITGETGAGKSILLGALGLIEGKRADPGVLLNKEKKCLVEAYFNISNYSIQHFFERHQLDYIPEETIIRREINPQGKSRAFINDTPVSLDILKELAQQLIDVHAQHDHLQILSPTFQLSYIDAFAKNQQLLKQYSNLFQEYKKQIQKLHQLKIEYEKNIQEKDYIEFLTHELNVLQPKENELDALEQELLVLENAEILKEKLSKIYVLFNDEDMGLFELLKKIKHEIQNISDILNDESLFERIQGVNIELNDIYQELNQKASQSELDEEKIQFLKQKVDEYQRLLKKHQVLKDSELVYKWQELQNTLDRLQHSDEEILELEKSIEEKKATLKQLCDQLSEKRKSVFTSVEQGIHKVLERLNMKDCSLKVDHTFLTDFTDLGIDEISFLAKTNKGSDFKEIQKAASGGELSRIMLALKYKICELVAMPTVIFDEIDTGVSGETAHKLGSLLEDMSTHMQILAITHLPQVAGKGKNHYKVFKNNKQNKTITSIEKLTHEQRIEEIAKLLGTGNITPINIENAKELLGL